MISMNNVQLLGKITLPPRVRSLKNGTKVAEIGLGIPESFKKSDGEWGSRMHFVDVVLWDRQAEYAENHLGKGDGLLVQGALQYDSWEGKKRRKAEQGESQGQAGAECAAARTRRETGRTGGLTPPPEYIPLSSRAAASAVREGRRFFSEIQVRKPIPWRLKIMKTIILILSVVFAALVFSACSQERSSPEAGDVELDWMTDFEAANARARESGKYLFMDFTGSDWCGWCIKLKKEVFSHEPFADFAEENLVLLELDFPKNKPQSDELKAQNEELAQRFGVRGFPTILIMSPEGKPVGQTGYRPGGAKAYVEHLQELIDEHASS